MEGSQFCFYYLPRVVAAVEYFRRSSFRCKVNKRMAFYRNVLITSGVIAFIYMMLKLFRNKEQDTSKDTSTSKESKEISLPTDKSVEKETDEKTVEPSGTMKLLRHRPNFFIAFQVNDVGIHQNVKKLQEKLLARNSLLFPAIVDVATLHVTLAVTHLATEKDIKTVKDKLDEWAEKSLKKYFEKPCILSFTGVKTFENKVAYVDLEKGENYKKISDLSESINNVLSSAGYSTDKKGFTPHLTFLKLSKDFKLFKSKKKFVNDFQALKEHKEHFGKQEVTHIQLLSMDKPKDKFGYYECFHQIEVSDSKKEMDHSECCSPIKKPKLSTKS